MSRKSASYPLRVDQSGSTTSFSASGPVRSGPPSVRASRHRAVDRDTAVAESPSETVIVSGTENETDPHWPWRHRLHEDWPSMTLRDCTAGEFDRIGRRVAERRIPQIAGFRLERCRVQRVDDGRDARAFVGDPVDQRRVVLVLAPGLPVLLEDLVAVHPRARRSGAAR